MNNTDLRITPWMNVDNKYNEAAFCIEISDGTNFFTTTSSGDAWGNGVITKSSNLVSALYGEKYIVTIINKNNIFSITYTNALTKQQSFETLTLEGADKFSSPCVYVMGQHGNLTVKIQNEINYDDEYEVIHGYEWWDKRNEKSTPLTLSEGDTIIYEIEIEADNYCGFFEYECWYKNFRVHGRTLEELQNNLTLQIKNVNNAIKTGFLTNGFEKQYNDLSAEEQQKMSMLEYYESLKSRKLSETEENTLSNLLYEENVDVLTNPDCKVQYFKPTNEDIQELKNLLLECPNIGINDLEKLYYEHFTNDIEINLYVSNIENAKRAIEQYDSNLEFSELLCELYEKQIATEELLISVSEELITLYTEMEEKNEDL